MIDDPGGDAKALCDCKTASVNAVADGTGNSGADRLRPVLLIGHVQQCFQIAAATGYEADDIFHRRDSTHCSVQTASQPSSKFAKNNDF
jgi:hypothetical protein